MRFLFASIALLASFGANATTVTWTFENVVFDDGGTLTGSFDIEDGLFFDGYGDLFDISVSGGSQPATNYQYLMGGSSNTEYGGLYRLNLAATNIVYPNSLAGSKMLQIVIAGDLGTAGTINLSPSVDFGPQIGAPPGLAVLYNQEGICSDAECSLFNVTPTRRLVSGSIVGVVTTVPVPAAFWLFATAISVLGFARRKIPH